jgi:K+-dependent Na+/Ca+ exchanger-like protein
METKDTKMAIFGRARRKRGDYFMYRVCSILLLFGGLLAFSTFFAANNKSSESFGIYLDQSEYSNRIRRSSPIENGTSSPLDQSETEEKNCSEPAYKEFPTDGLTTQQRSSGAIVIHILLSLYMFLGLAIICDDYFVASLEQIVEKLQLSDDVAGATFMAAGSSAPELFTSVIGVFVAKGDVGIGTIVGSAVFNILVIIGLCALLCDKPTQLSWWPLLRDSSYYLISIAILIVVMIDSEVFWYEALIMLIFYIGYIMIMKFNTTLQGIVLKLSCCKKKEETPEKIKLGENGTSEVNQTLMPKGIKVDINGPNGETVATVDEVAGMKYAAKDEMATVGMRMMISNNFAPKTRLRMASRLLIMEDAQESGDGKPRKNILAARETTTAHGETERVLMKETSRVSLSSPEGTRRATAKISVGGEAPCLQTSQPTIRYLTKNTLGTYSFTKNHKTTHKILFDVTSA